VCGLTLSHEGPFATAYATSVSIDAVDTVDGGLGRTRRDLSQIARDHFPGSAQWLFVASEFGIVKVRTSQLDAWSVRYRIAASPAGH
jgi:hypothetical protein